MLFRSAVSSGPAQSLQSGFSYFLSTLYIPKMSSSLQSLLQHQQMIRGKGVAPFPRSHQEWHTPLPALLSKAHLHWGGRGTMEKKGSDIHLAPTVYSLLNYSSINPVYFITSDSRDYTLLQCHNNLAQKDFAWNSSRYPGKSLTKIRHLKKNPNQKS